MPYRNTPFAVNEVYHIFNRSIAQQPIFLTTRDYERALDVFQFYSYASQPLRFSHYNRLPLLQRKEFFDNMQQNSQKQIETLAFCFMPNHVHFLIREIREKGITTFMSNFQNSYAKYFNVKRERSGSLFQSMFRAVRMETEEQLVHVARYIHLNPVTAFVIKDVEVLENYPWSSFTVYLGKQDQKILETKTILSYFPSIEKFVDFTKDQVDYQRQIGRIKHLTLENP